MMHPNPSSLPFDTLSTTRNENWFHLGQAEFYHSFQYGRDVSHLSQLLVQGSAVLDGCIHGE